MNTVYVALTVAIVSGFLLGYMRQSFFAALGLSTAFVVIGFLGYAYGKWGFTHMLGMVFATSMLCQVMVILGAYARSLR